MISKSDDILGARILIVNIYASYKRHSKGSHNGVLGFSQESIGARLLLMAVSCHKAELQGIRKILTIARPLQLHIENLMCPL